MFQRRHYQKIAETLAKNENVQKETLVSIRAMFKRDNQNYNDSRFWEAFNAEYNRIHGKYYGEEE